MRRSGSRSKRSGKERAEAAIEQIVGAHSRWDATAPLGHGIPPEDRASRKHVPRELLQCVVHMQSRHGIHGTGMLAQLSKRSGSRTVEGVCETVQLGRHAGTSMVVVLTCLHVIPTRKHAFETRVHALERTYMLDPDRLFYANDCHDVVVCAVRDVASLGAAWCPKAWNASWAHRPVSLLHHPNAVSEPVLTTGHVAAHAMHCFFHTADTLPGSSGAPVFVRVGRQWHWVGIHCEAVDLRVSGTRTAPMNVGCSMVIAMRALKRLGYACVDASE